MNLSTGKSLFLWLPDKVADGTPDGIAEAVFTLGLSDVNLKVGSGVYTYPYNFDYLPYITAIRKRNPKVKIRGWHYNFCANDPTFEIRVARQQIEYLDLDGYCLDIEADYKTCSDRASKAVRLMDGLREVTVARDIPLGVTSYRVPSYHPEIPWKEFLTRCDYLEPQNYWSQGIDPVYDLNRMIDEYLILFNRYGLPPIPFIPAGRAYYYSDGYPYPGPSAGEILSFMNACKNWAGRDGTKITGCTFWEFSKLYTQTGGPERFQAIADFDWPVDETKPPEPPPSSDLEERIIALEYEVDAHDELLSTHGHTIQDHEQRISALEKSTPANQTLTVEVTADKVVFGIAVGYDGKGKPIVEHPLVDERIIKNNGESFTVKRYAAVAGSSVDDPDTPTIIASGGDEYYLAVNGYENETYTFVDASKVKIVVE